MMKISNLATHPERYSTVAEVSSYLHVSPSYIRKLVQAGTLEAVRSSCGSRLVRISIASVRRTFHEPSGT